MLEVESMKWFWDTYCPDEKNRLEPYASPIRATNLENLPKALVVTAEFDPLRDEGEAYAKALESSGVDVAYKCYDGMIHDFFSTAAAFASSRTGFIETVEAIKKELN
jgi:acetyl esterase